MSDGYTIAASVELGQLRKLEKLADQKGLEIQALLNLALDRLLDLEEPGSIGPRGDVRYIAIKGVPRDFHRDFDAAETWAAEEAERTHNPYTVMCVHKNSLETALTAVYHGVTIHAMNEVDKEGWAE